MRVPDELEDAVYAAVHAALGPQQPSTNQLLAAIVDRSHRYTSERDRLAHPADAVGDLAARALFFTIADALKIAVPLGELIGRGALPAGRPLRVVDLGAGCGAMGLGLAVTLPTIDRCELLAIDSDSAALAIARDAIARLSPSIQVTTVVSDIRRAVVPPADLVLIGSLLNELSGDAPLAILERALAALPSDGAVIAIEPALRTTSRRLHELRDIIIERGLGHVFAPCTRRTAPCPALADATDWCHEDRAAVLPSRTRELARLTGLRDNGLKFSYLVIRRTACDLADDGDRAWRIVSAPRIAKGKRELFGCSASGRVVLRLLKRNRSDANREFAQLARGDVIAIDDPQANEPWIEIGPTTTVRRG